MLAELRHMQDFGSASEQVEVTFVLDPVISINLLESQAMISTCSMHSRSAVSIEQPFYGSQRFGPRQRTF